MSKYSGKCDLYDYVSMLQTKDYNKLNIYVRDFPVRLDIKERKDIVPFYGFVPYLCCGNEIRISNISYVDTMEEVIFNSHFNMVHRVIRRYKRHHKPLEWELIKKDLYIDDSDIIGIYIYIKDNYKEKYTEREKHTLMEKLRRDGVTYRSIEVYRKELYDEMIRNGYSEKQTSQWVYHK